MNDALSDWLHRHNVSPAAALELQAIFGLAGTLPQGGQIPGDGSESATQAAVRIEASHKGARLWRNNVGAGKLDDGSFVRWGLANDSAALNHVLKSSDLIGITREGQFLAREVKHAGWKYTGTDRERAQLQFIQLINSLGGDAAFATGTGSIK